MASLPYPRSLHSFATNVLPQNPRNTQKHLLRIFSHRIHGSTQIVRLRRPPTEFRSQKLGCAPIRSGGILPPQQPITLIFRGCSICENLWHLWEPPLSKKVLWILWILWEVSGLRSTKPVEWQCVIVQQQHDWCYWLLRRPETSATDGCAPKSA